MWSKRLKVWGIVALFLTLFPSQAHAFGEHLEYTYTIENPEEFVIGGTSFTNFGGELPDFLHDIYDITPKLPYNSEYGANIIIPNEEIKNETTHAPRNAPTAGYIQSPSSLNSGQMTNEEQYIPETNEDEPHNLFQTTAIEDVREIDGSIGTLYIDEIDLRVTAYDGDTYEAMEKGIGHVSSTSVWNGNIGLLGHNRGSNDYFGDLKNLEIGDEVTYKTNLGTRDYEVTFVGIISDTDWSKLQYTIDNRITMITCVEDEDDKRLVVQAAEID